MSDEAVKHQGELVATGDRQHQRAQPLRVAASRDLQHDRSQLLDAHRQLGAIVGGT